MLKILLATNQKSLNTTINIDVTPLIDAEIVGEIMYKNELCIAAGKYQPDIIIVTRALGGTNITLLESLLELHKNYPNVRIILLAGVVDYSNKEKMLELGTLVTSGIYDIVEGKSISRNNLIEAIQNPKVRDDVTHFLKHMKTNQILEDEIVEFEEEIIDGGDALEDGYKNVILVSSIKPGTGKSFISTNLATDIAKFGIKKKDGTKPKVALIEGDLQNLSVGTLLALEDEKHNLKTVMDAIATIFVGNNDNPTLVEDAVAINRTNEIIKNSFQQYYAVDNLYALTGSQLKIDELENIKPYYFSYLIEVVKDLFDFVVIDSNSSLHHISTMPLLQLCNKAYYVINLDYNNIRNNKRYQQILQNLGVFDKVKYVINEDIDEEYRKMMGQELLENIQCDYNYIKDAGFDVVARIPEIPKEIFLNRLYQGIPIILDETNYTLKARVEISNLTNDIWEVDNIDWLNKEFDKYKEKINNNNRIKKPFFKK